MRSLGGGEGLFGFHGADDVLYRPRWRHRVTFMWWRDCIREAHGGDHTPVVQLHLRYGMILFIASEVMFFVAWFWAYFDVACFPPVSSTSPIYGPEGNVLGKGEVTGRPRSAQRTYRWTVAAVPAEGFQRPSILGPAAGQHADPAALGHDGDLGAPRAAAQRPQGPDLGPRAHGRPRRSVQPAGLRVRPCRIQLLRPHLRLDLLHGDRASTASM